MAQPRPKPPPVSSPATVLARWPSANAQTAIALLMRRMNGVSTGRMAVQIRPFKLPARPGTAGAGGDKRAKDTGRNLFVVRAISGTEHMNVFVEDPSAPLRTTIADAVPPPGEAGSEEKKDGPPKPPHSRWSCCTLGSAAGSSPVATPFDAFLQRVLLGGPTATSTNVNSWIPRSTAITIEGWVVQSGGGANLSADWEVRIGTVHIKGGAAGGTNKGVIIEATYLAVPYLPAGSTFVHDFVSSLIPSQAIAQGEIQWITLDEETSFEAGLLPRDPEEWEWTEKHSALAYVQMFKQEGLL